MAYDNNEKKQDSVYSKRIRSGKRRTYFFDVRATRGNDFYLTITESRKRFDSDGYDRHKIFLYKEDFNKFAKGLAEAVEYVKTDLMPDFDFDAFNHEYPEGDGDYEPMPYTRPVAAKLAEEEEVVLADGASPATDEVGEGVSVSVSVSAAVEEVDKW